MADAQDDVIDDVTKPIWGFLGFFVHNYRPWQLSRFKFLISIGSKVRSLPIGKVTFNVTEGIKPPSLLYPNFIQIILKCRKQLNLVVPVV
jgi:hypothetical protein